MDRKMTALICYAKPNYFNFNIIYNAENKQFFIEGNVWKFCKANV